MITLFQHQQQALDQTEGHNRCAYYLDMGLGKTFVGSEKMMKLNTRINLVVCQCSKVQDWVEHFQDHYTRNCVFDLTNPKTFKWFFEQVQCEVPTLMIGVINYELTFRRKILKTLSGFTLMLDESSLITNETAKRSKFILKMQPESVILLSGTPTAGKYERLWSQVQLLGWNITKKAFWSSYVQTEWVENGDGFKREVITGYKHTEHLKKKLADHGCIFMKTADVIELPEQTEQKIFFKVTQAYKYFIKNSYIMLDTLSMCKFKDDSDYYGTDVTPRVELVGDNSLTKMLYARQLCGQWHKEKLEGLRDLVESTEDRLIIFYNFTAELEAMQKKLADLNRPYSVVNGSKKDLTAYDQADDSITFIQYQAGAMGGNYQKANKIIYFTLPLGKGSCDMWEQSKKRIHRIGQAKPCFYYYLLVKGTVEERNLAALKEGKELTDELFKNT